MTMKKGLMTLVAFLLTSIGVSAQDSNGWSYVFASYNPLTAKIDVQGADDISITAFSAGYGRTFALSKGTPLYVDGAVAVQYGFKNDFNDIDDLNFTMVSAKIPVSLLYCYKIPNSSVSLMPYAGFTLRGNIIGKFKYTGGSKDKTFDVFDKKDMEEMEMLDGKAWSRFQVGWQLGLKVRISDVLLGLQYGSDMSDIAKKTSISTVDITLGYCF